MTPEAFIENLLEIVDGAVVPGLVSGIETPPGRRPPEWLVELSDWHQSLSERGKEGAYQLARQAAASAIIAALGVLDGTKAIQESDIDGTLELRFITGLNDTLINDTDALSLGDEYQRLFDDRSNNMEST